MPSHSGRYVKRVSWRGVESIRFTQLSAAEPGWIEEPLRVSFGRQQPSNLVVIEQDTPYVPWRGWERVQLFDARFRKLRLFRRWPDGPLNGFSYNPVYPDPDGLRLAALDALAAGPFFSVPALDLTDASIGEIVYEAKHSFLCNRSSLDAALFEAAQRQPLPDKAIVLWEQCLEAGEPAAHFGVGRSLWQLGRTEEALEHFRTFTELAPFMPNGWIGLGRTWEALGAWPEAREAYAEAFVLQDGLEMTDLLRTSLQKPFIELLQEDADVH